MNKKKIKYRSIPVTQEEQKLIEWKEEELSIEATRERLKLKVKSKEWLENKLAELWLKNENLQTVVERYYKKAKQTQSDSLWVSAGKKPKSLERGLVKTLSRITPSKGGKGSAAINPEKKLRDELKESAAQDILSGVLQYGRKGKWIENKLKDPKYSNLSYDTLYRDIKLK